MARRGKKTAKTAPIKDKPKSLSMMGKSREPFAKKAKKSEPDDMPISPPRPPSTNKNTREQKSARVKRLTGLML